MGSGKALSMEFVDIHTLMRCSFDGSPVSPDVRKSLLRSPTFVKEPALASMLYIRLSHMMDSPSATGHYFHIIYSVYIIYDILM